jgi:hypothetical protein
MRKGPPKPQMWVLSPLTTTIVCACDHNVMAMVLQTVPEMRKLLLRKMDRAVVDDLSEMNLQSLVSQGFTTEAFLRRVTVAKLLNLKFLASHAAAIAETWGPGEGNMACPSKHWCHRHAFSSVIADSSSGLQLGCCTVLCTVWR